MAFGAALSLGALLAGVALMAASGRYIALSMLGTAVLVPLALQMIGVARVVLRYLERVFTHEATFRLLATLRVWFYTRLEPLAPAALP